MTPAKIYLQSIRDEDAEIQKMLRKRDYFVDMATRGTGSMEATRVSGGPAHSRVEDYVCRMIDYEAEEHMNDRIDALADKKRDAERVIERISLPRFREVLRLRYLQDSSWKWGWRRIAETMGCSERTLFNIHGWALLQYNNAQNTTCSDDLV